DISSEYISWHSRPRSGGIVVGDISSGVCSIHALQRLGGALPDIVLDRSGFIEIAGCGQAGQRTNLGKNMYRVIAQRVSNNIDQAAVGGRAPGVAPLVGVSLAVIQRTRSHRPAELGWTARITTIEMDGGPGVGDGSA